MILFSLPYFGGGYTHLSFLHDPKAHGLPLFPRLARMICDQEAEEREEVVPVQVFLTVIRLRKDEKNEMNRLMHFVKRRSYYFY